VDFGSLDFLIRYLLMNLTSLMGMIPVRNRLLTVF